MKLIVMGCCATKRADAAPMPAIDRYDGPMWRTLRARLAQLPNAARAVETGELKIMVLSARYGLISADVSIADYNRTLTASRAAKLLRDPTCDLQMLPALFEAAEKVLFAGGALYRDTMWRAANGSLQHIMKVSETDGAGIGLHRAELGAWMVANYGQAERLAA